MMLQLLTLSAHDLGERRTMMCKAPEMVGPFAIGLRVL
jgi:hypothetical protein